MQNKPSNIMDFVFQEFYCLEDFRTFNMISNFKSDINEYNFQQMNYSNYTCVISCIKGKEKQIIKETKNFKRIYLFIIIYYKDKYINFLINRTETISPKELLDKINNNIYMKTPIKIKLRILEFPLVKYFLQKSQNIEQNIDIVFILKDIIDINNYSVPNFNNYQNNNFNNNYNQNFSNQLNNSQQFLKDEKIKELEKLLNEEKNKNKELNLKINDLEFMLKEALNKNTELNQKIKNLKEHKKDIIFNNNLISEQKLTEIINKNKIEINELKAKLKRYPFELLDGEKMISIIFNSVKQDINYSVICKNTDLFVNIELKLYEEYPQYSEVENFFTTNGFRINKYKSLEVNKIKNNSVIMLQSIE